ncbi:arylsulfatase [Tamlana fucoidanivorans]|uniref:Arylsulfatase n=1 Tax=Allotamlana fucoidanivorans TaxID=2583814 RepID=A0A5C4SNZ8_9FLAO|nr:arylsulfatase [Tamlana fucoidanivorans]TNJ46004.1 arylsulfatase [Tamlana fucoidanivorans]
MRKNRHLISIGLCVLLLLGCKESSNKSTENSMNTAQSSSENIIKPNIIYILADDLGYGDLGVYGQIKFKTPNIDKLASEGMLFTQHYSGSTVCAPSRSALLTGMHTGHTVVRGNKEMEPEGQYPMPDDTYTLAESLKKAGYTTGAFGKWGLGFPRSEGDPVNQGFDTFFGYNCQRLGHHYYPDHLWSNRDSIVIEGNKGLKKKVYGPDIIHQKTLEFIEKNKKEPFFAYVASIIPHAELAAPDSLMQKYRDKFLPEKEFVGVEFGEAYGDGHYLSQKESHAAFVAMIDLLDQQVGEIMAKVDELGISDNTIVVFTSDNGPHREGGGDPDYFDSNGPLKGTKRDLYEGGVRVPMLVKWPNRIKPGSKSDHISAFWDVFPTFSDIADVNSPDNLDGISFLPTLIGDTKNQKQHEYLYWEFHEKGGRQAVRKDNWKAVKYNVLKNPNAPVELYDLTNDIGETNNVADAHPEVVRQMEAILKEARTPSDVFTFSQETFLNSN